MNPYTPSEFSWLAEVVIVNGQRILSVLHYLICTFHQGSEGLFSTYYRAFFCNMALSTHVPRMEKVELILYNVGDEVEKYKCYSIIMCGSAPC